MYAIEIGRLRVSKQDYSYARRAQATTYLPCWRQVAIAQTEPAAIEYAEFLIRLPDYKSFGVRIEPLASAPTREIKVLREI
jgi:hypothetical protein